MPKKRSRMDVLSEIVQEDEEGGLKVRLPESVRGDLRVMRRLHHRMVDFMADHGLLEGLVHDVEARLTVLSFAIVGDYVTEMVREARAATSKPKESPAPKKGAKRGSK